MTKRLDRHESAREIKVRFYLHLNIRIRVGGIYPTASCLKDARKGFPLLHDAREHLTLHSLALGNKPCATLMLHILVYLVWVICRRSSISLRVCENVGVKQPCLADEGQCVEEILLALPKFLSK